MPPPQRVVVYDVPGRKGIVYDTAYSDAEVRHGVIRCAERHGRTANVRSRPAKEHFAKYLR